LTRVAMLAGLALAACQTSDVGKSCPQLLADTQPTDSYGSRAETQEVVEQNVTFPCDDFVCVATAGRSGYCTQKCREDVGCPDGFVCRTVQAVGPFANDKFCVWKHCDKRSDCGNMKSFCCTPVPGASPTEEIKLCDFANDGKCP
jgi:hypothetical protein